MTSLVWRRSSDCESSTCVEVAALPDGAAVRDGKDPDGPILTFGAVGWSAFLAGLRGGEFDLTR